MVSSSVEALTTYPARNARVEEATGVLRGSSGLEARLLRDEPPTTAFKHAAGARTSTDSGCSTTEAASSSPVRLRYGAAAGQGVRQTMEDAHIIWPSFADGSSLADPGAAAVSCCQQSAFFGLFDGHNGSSAAEYGREHLAKALLASEHFPHDLAAAMRHAFLDTDEAFYRAVTAGVSQSPSGGGGGGQTLSSQQQPYDAAAADSGATALSAVLWGERLVIANAGDCRAVLSRRGKALDLTRDHKPSCARERQRIQAAGGFVCADGRLSGQLSVARAMGDYGARAAGCCARAGSGGGGGGDGPSNGGAASPRVWLKRPSDEPGPFRFVGPLTAEPEVTVHELAPEDEFVVLACDGLWDVLSSQRCVELGRAHLRAHNDPAATAQYLVDTAFEKHASDNVTCLVVCFSEDAPPPRFRSAASRAMSRSGLASLSTALSACDLAAPGPLGGGAGAGPLGAAAAAAAAGPLGGPAPLGQASLGAPLFPQRAATPALSAISSEGLGEVAE